MPGISMHLRFRWEKGVVRHARDRSISNENSHGDQEAAEPALLRFKTRKSCQFIGAGVGNGSEDRALSSKDKWVVVNVDTILQQEVMEDPNIRKADLFWRQDCAEWPDRELILIKGIFALPDRFSEGMVGNVFPGVVDVLGDTCGEGEAVGRGIMVAPFDRSMQIGIQGGDNGDGEGVRGV
ncbi:MAG: hypothetical protein Q9209_005982 [Squamulea sp. 1 TL-2023]